MMEIIKTDGKHDGKYTKFVQKQQKEVFVQRTAYKTMVPICLRMKNISFV